MASKRAARCIAARTALANPASAASTIACNGGPPRLPSSESSRRPPPFLSSLSRSARGCTPDARSFCLGGAPGRGTPRGRAGDLAAGVVADHATQRTMAAPGSTFACRTTLLVDGWGAASRARLAWTPRAAWMPTWRGSRPCSRQDDRHATPPSQRPRRCEADRRPPDQHALAALRLRVLTRAKHSDSLPTTLGRSG